MTSARCWTRAVQALTASDVYRLSAHTFLYHLLRGFAFGCVRVANAPTHIAKYQRDPGHKRCLIRLLVSIGVSVFLKHCDRSSVRGLHSSGEQALVTSRLSGTCSRVH